MAAGDRIKGITIEIGGDTSALSKALGGVNKDIGSTQKELKEVERLLKLDPTNTTLLKQKQELLAKSVAATKEKLDKLKTANDQLNRSFNSDVPAEQQRALQREIAQTEAKLESLEGSARETSVALSGVSDATKKLSATTGDLANKTRALSGAAAGVLTSIVATVPATAELRKAMSQLDANAVDNAVSIDAVRAAWEAFTLQSGETDSSVEAVSNLLQAGFTESNLQKAVEGLAGAAQRFPDTLKVESLADGLQETLATGAATGAFGELLDRLGIGAETFSTQLEGVEDKAAQLDLVLQTLADAGLGKTYEAWRANNEEMLASEEANLRLQESMAKIAELALPVITEVTEAVTAVLEWVSDLDEGQQKMLVGVVAAVAVLSPLLSVVSSIAAGASALAAAWPAVSAGIGGVATALGPVVFAAIGIVALIAGIASKMNEMGITAEDVINGIKDGLQSAQDAFADFTERASDAVKNFLNGGRQIYNDLVSWISGGVNALIDMLNAIPDVVPLLGGLNIPHVEPTLLPMLASGGTVLRGSAIVGEAGPELLTVGSNGTTVTPLSGSSGAKGAVNVENMIFYGYTQAQGRAMVRDLNRQLGGLY